MRHSIQNLGQRAVFLLPSLKLRYRLEEGSVEDTVHEYLLDNFDGYTSSTVATASFSRDLNGHEYQGEYRNFTVAFNSARQLKDLAAFLSGIAVQLKEPSIYIEIADDICLIVPSANLKVQ